MSAIRAAIRLSRWREHVPFTAPLTVLGALLAAQQTAQAVDWRLAAVLAANVLAMSFAFMLNDIEDAPDDALDSVKKAHNVISSGHLSRRLGLRLTGLVALMSMLLYAICGLQTGLLGAGTLALCALYSAHPFRLKARPITDVLSHALMLSGLLVACGYFTFGQEPGSAWLVIAAATFFSAYGQFYNQVADATVDRQAGLRNTVVLLGKGTTTVLSYACVLLALGFMLAAVLQGLFPAWLGWILLIAVISCSLFPWELDMRGNRADTGGSWQRPSLLVANIVVFCWLADNMGWLVLG